MTRDMSLEHRELLTRLAELVDEWEQVVPAGSPEEVARHETIREH